MASYQDDNYPDSWRTPTRAEKATIAAAGGQCHYNYKNCTGNAVMTSGDHASCYSCARTASSVAGRY
ncbi:hypothetical protein P3H15_33215 [Rhodococcus sp. T2V]|uniref:hypothetical protein n=1 Tax=Rhodococcus sp. T2V TaxID=3034164 RepID=UPI0023E28EBC|nr:hypothetical protein [Rhodococcus sp. T2V]MDF3309880.1 hypothetical protein [Rhodococcus sp. T2V]